MGKKSFVMYDSWATLLSNIPTEQAGILIQAICKNRLGEDVKIDDPSVAGMFAMIAPQLEADDKKYQAKCDRISSARKESALKNDESALKREKSALKRDESDMNRDESALKREKSALKNDESGSVSDSDSASDSVSDSASDSVSESVYDSDSENDRPSGEKEKDKARSARPVRHKRGEYGHVMLSDEELTALNGKHGESETQAAIKVVDEYCEKTGKKYKNYKLVLEDWGYSSASKGARSGTTEKPVNSLREKWGISADDL